MDYLSVLGGGGGMGGGGGATGAGSGSSYQSEARLEQQLRTDTTFGDNVFGNKSAGLDTKTILILAGAGLLGLFFVFRGE